MFARAGKRSTTTAAVVAKQMGGQRWRTMATSSTGNTEAGESQAGRRNPPDLETTRVLALQAALPRAVQHGWTMEALEAGVVDVMKANGAAAEGSGGPAVGMARSLFPRGAIELVEHFVMKADSRMKQTLESSNMANMVQRERVVKCVRTRLEQLLPYLSVWPQGMAMLAMPQHAVDFTLPQYARMIDEMWYQSGDRSVDLNWYLKRAALLGVYSSAELHLIVDDSTNYEATWEFVERRVDDMVMAGQQLGKAQQLGEGLFGSAIALLQQHAPSANTLSKLVPNVETLASVLPKPDDIQRVVEDKLGKKASDDVRKAVHEAGNVGKMKPPMVE